MTRYATPSRGHPDQSALLTGRATFTEAYTVLPRGTMRDIVTSLFPGWTGSRGWVLARPLSGFAETFSWCIVEVAPGGGSEAPESDSGAEAVLFVAEGALTLAAGGADYALTEGGYAYLPPGGGWTIRNDRQERAVLHWVRKRYEPVAGLAVPDLLVTHESDVTREAMPGTEGRWATQRFVDPADLAHDMHVNIVTFEPGAVIPFEETHVMEHGLYVLEGRAVYQLNGDWVEVEAGDFLWLRAFCPQSCYAAGQGPFRYLLYKDVNRLPRLR